MPSNLTRLQAKKFISEGLLDWKELKCPPDHDCRSGIHIGFRRALRKHFSSDLEPNGRPFEYKSIGKW